MSFAQKFNGRKFNIDTTGFEYKSLAEMFSEYQLDDGSEVIFPLTGVFINTKGHYGDAPVFTTASEYVNIPAHMLSTAKQILEDDEAIRDINDGIVGFTIYKYHSEAYNKECYGVAFVDM